MTKHDHGLQFDLAVMEARLKARRRALNWLLAGGTAALVAACCGGDGSTGRGRRRTAAW